jgi:hypothetical protein
MSKQLSPAGQKVALAITCSIFIVVGLALWIPMFVVPVLDWNQMRSWREVPCTVLRGPAGLGQGLSSVFAFRYEYDGETYESTEPGMGGIFTPSVWTAKPGTVAVCYVNPRAPKQAVFNRDFDPEILVWCAPLIFVIFPLMALVLGLRNIGRPKEPEAPVDSVTLERRRMSGCGFVMQFVFLLFFGGPAVLIAVIPGFAETIVVRLVYLVPLGFVSLLLIRGMFRSFIGLFKLQVALTVTPATGVPGQSIEVRWTARGPWEKVKNFRITFEGREETRASTNRHAEVQTSPIAVIDVAKGGPKDLRRGSSKLKIPGDAMHTFSHGKCSIVWIFRISGIGPADDEHKYEVYPVRRDRT